MNEDTRRLILRLQGEDLAALWTASTDDNSDIDATLRAYRRQLSLLDRHLENARQTKTTEGVGGATNHAAVTSALQVTDTDAPIKTEDDEVHQFEGVYSRHETPASDGPAFPIPSAVNATSARSISQVSDSPVVRLPPFASMTGDQSKVLEGDGREAAIRRKRAEDVREEAERQNEIQKQVAFLDEPIRDPQRLRPVPLHAQPVKEFSIHDIPKVQDQKKVERMMVFAPGRTASVLYNALETCYGRFDDALDMVFRGEGVNVSRDYDSISLDRERHTARFSARPRTASKPQVKASTQTIAEKSPFGSKPTLTTTSTAVACAPASALTRPFVAATTNLKRSANHLATSKVPPAKKSTSDIIKKEPEIKLGLPAQGRTIRDQVEDLLQSSRLLPSPTPRTRGPRRGGRARAVPPRSSQPRPASNPTSVMGFNTGHCGQHYGGSVGPRRIGGVSQYFHQTPPCLDVNVFNAARLSKQKQMIGEILYPKIHEQQPTLVCKITGMLLEMDNADLFNLIIDETALRNKVEEALRVYNDYVNENHGKDA